MNQRFIISYGPMWSSSIVSLALHSFLFPPLVTFCTLMWFSFQLNKSFVKVYQSFSNSLLMFSHSCSSITRLLICQPQLVVCWKVDSLSTMMLVLITLIYTVVNIFSTDYLIGDTHYIQFHAVIHCFTFAFSLLVLSNNLVVLFFS